jgi:hypothetical protein
LSFKDTINHKTDLMAAHLNLITKYHSSSIGYCESILAFLKEVVRGYILSFSDEIISDVQNAYDAHKNYISNNFIFTIMSQILKHFSQVDKDTHEVHLFQKEIFELFEVITQNVERRGEEKIMCGMVEVPDWFMYDVFNLHLKSEIVDTNLEFRRSFYTSLSKLIFLRVKQDEGFFDEYMSQIEEKYHISDMVTSEESLISADRQSMIADMTGILSAVSTQSEMGIIL